jgi:RimJ/RimL family protein N-acetyltransferase
MGTLLNDALLNDYSQPIGLPLPDWTPPARPPRQPIEGRFCRLEPLDVHRHAAALFAAYAAEPDERSWTYLAYGPFSTPESYRDWMSTNCLGDDPLFFAILDVTDGQAVGGGWHVPERGCEGRGDAAGGNAVFPRPSHPCPDRATLDGQVVGVASYLRIAPAAGSIEVGHLRYAPRLQRSPAATEAMYLMMRTAFELGYRRYEWKCDALNAPSRAAAQRLGLSFEGIFRQASVYKGRSRDTAWYATIDSEWPALRQAFLTWLDPANFDHQGRQRTRLSDLTRPILKGIA